MADAAGVLSAGVLREVTEGQTHENPIVQCVQIKPMSANQATGQERWRVVFNDSINFIQGMLATQSNNLINDGTLKRGSICRLTQFTANFVKDKHILIVVDLEVLKEYGEPEKIGQPVAITYDGAKPAQQEDVKPQPGNIAGNGFYGNKPQQQSSSELSARPKATVSHNGRGNITPIEAVSPYTHKWTIKARCTHKGDIKTWHNKNGEGKLFSVNFLDDSGEIRATGFNDSVDQWYEFLTEGNVYYISSPCKVQLAKKQFSNVNNDYELTFERDTTVEKAEDHDGVPQVRYNFTDIAALQNVDKDTTIDCIGVLQEVGEVNEIVSKSTNKPYSKRELTLVDNSGYNVRLTVWGKTAESFDARPESVVAFKGVKVSDFGGRSLSLLSSGSMNIDPDIDEAYKLKGWYDGEGRNGNFASHANSMAAAGATSGGRPSDFKTIAQVYDDKDGQSETTDWFSIKATIVYVKQDSFAYPACRTTDPKPCNKKVTEHDEGQWRCEQCQMTWDRPNYRYIMSVNVSDHTGQIWLSCFDEVGVQVMGMSANDLMALKEEGDDKRVGEAFSDANCKSFIFKCKAKMDTFQDQQRVRYQVQYVNPIDYAREAKKLADIIKQYSIQDNSMFVN
ncbi:replication factor-a protein 1 [Zymoseptoria brevis]|uniref:Replication protein A subunit n=1 Tax=Zymoseptoria brevis TaxID=1047168 RepID=A0A0F4GQR0_9PEZI|nr:replication factor-a protein 1 [Zymoseptoria brevis]